MELIRAQWEKAGMGSAQMEQAEGFTRAMFTPVAQAIMTPLMLVLFGVVISLIAAAFLKRPAPASTPPPV